MKKNVVIIGGGNGSATIINALKKNPDLNLTAVIGMSDSGGSSGAIREKFRLLPPGDILRAVLALSPYDYYRFLRPVFFKNRIARLPKLNKELRSVSVTEKRDVSLGNLIITLVSLFEGSFMQAIEALAEALEATGRALPASLEQSHLCVELADGRIIKTEAAIDRPAYDRNQRIKRAWLEPAAKAYPEALSAVKQADYIVLCPGSLYTSLIATLLPVGLKEAIRGGKAKIAYIVGNAYEQIGETGPIKLSDILSELESYLPRPVDYIVYNNHRLSPIQKKHYAERQWGALDLNVKDLKNRKLIAADFESAKGGLSPDKLYAPLMRIMSKQSK